MFSFRKNKIYIVLAIVGLVVAFLVLFFIWPLWMKVNNDSKNLASIRNNTDILKIQSDQIEEFKQGYQDYKPNLEKMERLFVDTKNPVDFIKFLEDTASLTRITPQISLMVAQKDPAIVSYQIFVSDDFLKVLDFSRKLENGLYLVQIQNITIKSANQNIEDKNFPSGKVDANFTLNAFAK